MCRSHADVVYGMDHDRRVILRSRDRGTNWSEYTRPGWQMRKLDPLPTFAAHPTDTSIVYSIDAAGDLARFDGNQWQSLGVRSAAGGPSWNHVRSVTLDPRHPEIIYAGMFTCGGVSIMRSTNAGSTWVDISYNLPALGTSGMVVNPHTGELWKGSVAGTWILPPPYAQATPRLALEGSPAVSCRPQLFLAGLSRHRPRGGVAFDLAGRRATRGATAGTCAVRVLADFSVGSR
jgi:hypothetical protein